MWLVFPFRIHEMVRSAGHGADVRGGGADSAVGGDGGWMGGGWWVISMGRWMGGHVMVLLMVMTPFFFMRFHEDGLCFFFPWDWDFPCGLKAFYGWVFTLHGDFKCCFMGFEWGYTVFLGFIEFNGDFMENQPFNMGIWFSNEKTVFNGILVVVWGNQPSYGNISWHIYSII